MGNAQTTEPSQPQDADPGDVTVQQLAEADTEYENFTKSWDEAYEELRREHSTMDSHRARALLECLRKAHGDVSSTAEVLRLDNEKLKKDLGDMQKKITDMEDKLRCSSERNERLSQEMTAMKNDLQRQIDDLHKKFPDKGSAANKMAEELTTKVATILSAHSTSPYAKKISPYATTYF